MMGAALRYEFAVDGGSSVRGVVDIVMGTHRQVVGVMGWSHYYNETLIFWIG